MYSGLTDIANINWNVCKQIAVQLHAYSPMFGYVIFIVRCYTFLLIFNDISPYSGFLNNLHNHESFFEKYNTIEANNGKVMTLFAGINTIAQLVS